MKKLMQSFLGRNWKTTATGVSMICSALGDVTHSLSTHGTINWNIDVPAVLTGVGLICAKDSDNHSTVAEVDASTAAVKQ
jgi:hypothetical protein